MPGDIILLYIHVYHKWRSYDIWFLKCKVQQTENFVILGHFLPFQPLDNLENQNFKIEKNTWRYYHFTHLRHKRQSYDVWFLGYEAWQTELFVILDCFLPFYPPNNPKNQNFEKMKKTPGDIIILHMCTINDNHMMYGSWDMERDRQNFLSFWTIFCPFTPLTTWKIKILKKWKNCLEMLSFYIHVPQMTIIWCKVPEILKVTEKTFCHFGPFFALLPP